MKKLFVSASLAAIGAASLYADEYAPDFTALNASKLWSVSGTLRGFYDDNYDTAPNNSKRGSLGFEFSPSVDLIVPLQQTELGLRYTYGLYYYQDRQNLGQNPIDQTHEADLWLDHAFTERLEGKVQDTFVVAQEPALSAVATALPYRVEGNNIQNNGTLTLHTEWSMLFSTDLGYQNTFVHYQQHGATDAGILAGGPPTYGGLLDEDGHLIWLNLNYQYLPNLSFLVGYQFGLVNYLGDEPIGVQPFTTDLYFSDSRDEYSHYLYIGGQYSITANLSALAEVGAQYSDNYNLPSFDHQSGSYFQPYANIALTYTYLPGDYAQLGFTQSESSSDVAAPSTSSGLTLFEETSVIYASLNHQITPKLLGSIIGHYQYGAFQGGAFDSSAQAWYSIGLNLAYTFTPNFSAEVGYNYDDVTTGGSGAGSVPGYERNRVYIGVTGTY